MRRGLVVALTVATLGLAACSDAARPGVPTSDPTSPSAATSESVDPDTPLSWGPTAGDLATARELVSDWSAEQLAGQVIVGRFYSTDPEEPAALVRDLHLAGVQITSSSISDEAGLRAMTAAVADAHAADGREFPAVIGVDQEGGSVSHLSGIAADFPAFQAAGVAVESGDRAVVREAAKWTGLELRDLGFTWVFAPVADVTIGAGDPTIGTRSPSMDPGMAAEAVVAAERGYRAAGIVSTVKHFPGHGSVSGDSHLGLPTQGQSLQELQARDLVPFEAAIAAGAPAVMVGHLDVRALAPGVPSSLAPEVYDYLRDDLGFEGVAITDSLGMGAVVATTKPAVTALNAGADLLLMPANTRLAHETVTAAVESGEIPRERILEAASRVVAMQLWQQRLAESTPVPDDVHAQAEAAAAALSAY